MHCTYAGHMGRMQSGLLMVVILFKSSVNGQDMQSKLQTRLQERKTQYSPMGDKKVSLQKRKMQHSQMCQECLMQVQVRQKLQ